MKVFIDKIAELINEQKIPDNELCIVFPNRRAGLFLKRKLIPTDGKPRWVPQIISVEDFVFSVSRLKEPDNVTLLAMLYQAHCSFNPEAVSFDSFLSWGSQILRDFEEVDQYMVNATKLFHYIRDAKEIDLWKPGETPTEFESNYITFFESLADHYHKLNEILQRNNSAYQGIATRRIAENPEQYLDNLPWTKVIFAGFNALTPAQLLVIKYLVKKGKAEIVFDSDSYYMENPAMEAGLFMRKYMDDSDLGKFKQVTSEFIDPQRNIYSCGIPGRTGQARIAGRILQSIPIEKHHNTAVVLADESLLLPLLNALPAELSKFNVTMGFPLVQAPLYSLVDSLFKLHINASNNASANPSFYHKDVTSVLQNSYLHSIIDKTLSDRLIRDIKKNNYSYISLKEIYSLVKQTKSDTLDLIFSANNSTGTLLDTIGSVLEHLKEVFTSKANTGTDIEVLFSIYDKISSLDQCLKEQNIQIESLSTLYSFFREIASTAKVPFYGEPLEGIQIMGMLETRVLDFENVILLSLNEDILPSAKSNRSFIPFDIRVQSGLPTHSERQAVFAYHFYRLIQRCNNAWLVYNEDGDVLGGGEKSRYLSQLEWELPRNGMLVKKLTLPEASNMGISAPISIPKVPEVMKVLYEKAEKGFSFSSIKKYINCSLSFYFSYVLKLEETEEVEEEISAQTMGTILHAILQDLYEGAMGTKMKQEVLENAIDQIPALVAGKTGKYFPELRIDSGKIYSSLK
jgi:ATP-dependent helicase/nuclease subunit B